MKLHEIRLVSYYISIVRRMSFSLQRSCGKGQDGKWTCQDMLRLLRSVTQVTCYNKFKTFNHV